MTGSVLADGALTPIANASVSVAGRSTSSGADGTFSLSNLRAGIQTVSVSVSGGRYQGFTEQVDLAPMANDLGEIYLTPITSSSNGTVTGRIVDQNRQAVGDADIQLGLLSGHSRSDGSFAVYNVPPMTYSLLVTKGDDMTATRSSVVVQAGQTTDVGEVVLSAGPPGPPF